MKRRRLEAMLGFDPDEADPKLLDRLIVEARTLGEDAIVEVAADHKWEGDVVTAAQIQGVAESKGFQSNPRDTVRLAAASQLSPIGQVPGWKRGAEAAQALRLQECLGAAPISNERLAQMAGVPRGALKKGEAVGMDFSFALDETTQSGRVVFRSKWETGRRFDLARLLGDRLAWSVPGKLLPATRTYTYRQKLQRAFAAELLCPFEALDEMLARDYSSELY